MGWIRCVRCKKILTWLRGTKFCINCTSSPRFAPSFMELRNDRKCTQTLWNTPKHEFRVQWGGSGMFVAKNYNVTSCTNLCINCTSSVCFATSFMQLRNDPKCSQILRNGPKHYFMVQWGGLGAFIAKKTVVTSWHELLYELNQLSMFCNKFHAVTKRSQMHPNTPKRIESLG